MNDIAAAPRLIKNLYLNVDGDNYAAAVTDVQATSPAAIEIVGGTDEAVYADTPSGGRRLVVAGIQDWETPESLCNYLLDHEGEEATVIFSPRRAGGAFFQCDVVLSAPPIGGQRNNYGTFSLTFIIVSPITRVTDPGES